MKKYPTIHCKSCKHAGKLAQFVSGVGSILVCPNCGVNFPPPAEKKKK